MWFWNEDAISQQRFTPVMFSVGTAFSNMNLMSRSTFSLDIRKMALIDCRKYPFFLPSVLSFFEGRTALVEPVVLGESAKDDAEASGEEADTFTVAGKGGREGASAIVVANLCLDGVECWVGWLRWQKDFKTL